MQQQLGDLVLGDRAIGSSAVDRPENQTPVAPSSRGNNDSTRSRHVSILSSHDRTTQRQRDMAALTLRSKPYQPAPISEQQIDGSVRRLSGRIVTIVCRSFGSSCYFSAAATRTTTNNRTDPSSLHQSLGHREGCVVCYLHDCIATL